MPAEGVGATPAAVTADGGEGGRIESWDDLPDWAKDRLFQAQFIGMKVLTDEQVNQAFQSTQGSCTTTCSCINSKNLSST